MLSKINLNIIVNNLPPILSTNIPYQSIDVFSTTINKKRDNDNNNKLREEIILAVINNTIPDDFYQCNKWSLFKTNVFKYLDNLFNNVGYNKIKCEKKAGRSNNYDFDISIYHNDTLLEEKKVEFKYNAKNISDCPQWVSPMNPSQYLNNNYEEFYYNNYLPSIYQELDITIPDKSVYLLEINKPEPPCMKLIQEKYYNLIKN